MRAGCAIPMYAIPLSFLTLSETLQTCEKRFIKKNVVVCLLPICFQMVAMVNTFDRRFVIGLT